MTPAECTVRIIHRHQFTELISYREIQHKLFNRSVFNDSNINAKTICQVTSTISQMKTSTDANMLSALQYMYYMVIIILQKVKQMLITQQLMQ